MDMKQIAGLFLLLSVFGAGCCTAKGAGKDLSQVPQKAPQCIRNIGDGLAKADAWVEDHMW